MAAVVWDDTTTQSLAEGIDALSVRQESQVTYERDYFEHWIDADSNGCDTRAEVLKTESRVEVSIGEDCQIVDGSWDSYYDGETTAEPSDLDIDHVVPLAEAWRSGAWDWTDAKRRDYANDLAHDETLVAVSASSNRSKGDKDPDAWLPDEGRCRYLAEWVAVKTQWSLSIDDAEATALRDSARTC